jgi:hypothetical protein
VPVNNIIEGSKKQPLRDTQDSQVKNGTTMKTGAIAREVEIHSEITMTDNDAEGSTDDGCVDAEDDKSVFEMLVSSFVTPF